MYTWVTLLLLKHSFCYTDIVDIEPQQRSMARNDIECPGDTRPYRCSIVSDSDQLTWTISIQGQMSINITYSENTNDRTSLNSYITTVLTEHRSGVLIRSILEVTVRPDIPTDQIMLECSNANVNDSAHFRINTARKYSILSSSIISLLHFFPL